MCEFEGAYINSGEFLYVRVGKYMQNNRKGNKLL